MHSYINGSRQFGTLGSKKLWQKLSWWKNQPLMEWQSWALYFYSVLNTFSYIIYLLRTDTSLTTSQNNIYNSCPSDTRAEINQIFIIINWYINRKTKQRTCCQQNGSELMNMYMLQHKMYNKSTDNNFISLSNPWANFFLHIFCYEISN